MQSVAVSAILLIIAVALFIFLCYQGFGPIPCAILCAAIVGISAEGGFINALFHVFVGGSLEFTSMMLLPFISGGIFGTLMNVTGSSESIGRWLVKKLGPHLAPYAIGLLTMILILGGVMSYVFVVAYLAFGILKAADLPRVVGLTIMGGYCGVTMTLIPSASTVNLVPTFFLGTNLYSGAVIGIGAAVAALVLVTVYVELLIRACRKDHIGWDPMESEAGKLPRTDSDLPPVYIAAIPVAFVVIACIVMIAGFGIDSSYAIVFTQVIGTVLLYVLNMKRIHENKFQIVHDGACSALVPLIGSSCVVGFASVVALTPVYTAVIQWLAGLQIHPYVLTVISTAIMCAICADAMGGMSAFLAVLAPQILATGANPAVIHWLTTSTSGTFDSLPHNGNINICLQVFGLSHKQGYKHLFMVQAIIPTLYTIVALVIALVFF